MEGYHHLTLFESISGFKMMMKRVASQSGQCCHSQTEI